MIISIKLEFVVPPEPPQSRRRKEPGGKTQKYGKQFMWSFSHGYGRVNVESKGLMIILSPLTKKPSIFCHENVRSQNFFIPLAMFDMFDEIGTRYFSISLSLSV